MQTSNSAIAKWAHRAVAVRTIGEEEEEESKTQPEGEIESHNTNVK